MTVSALRAFVLLFVVGAVPAGTCAAQDIPTTASGRFEIFDANRDGVVDKDEYDSDALFSAMDSDRNFRVSAAELQAVLGPQGDGEPSAADRIRGADMNGDGELTDEELRRSAEMKFHWIDTNQDEKVDLAEFKSGFGRP